MDRDMFGNLRDWSQVLERLAHLKETRTLDEHQSGLARILRYRGNWRLLERVLTYGEQINQPTNDFLEELFRVISDTNLAAQTRILAANASSCLIVKKIKKGTCQEAAAICNMTESINSSGPPIFQEALSRCLESVKQIAGPSAQALNEK